MVSPDFAPSVKVGNAVPADSLSLVEALIRVGFYPSLPALF
jgi:hypothetical protein